MDDALKEIECNIRACLVSYNAPCPIHNLRRDYDTLVAEDIPFKKFNYSTLEEFLRSFQSLRVCGSGSRATVEAIRSNASQHITQLISRQKSSGKKPASLPPRKNYPPPSYRGRGTRSRGRGGSNSSRPYPPSDQGPKNYSSRDYSSWDQPARDNYGDESTRDYPPRDNAAGGDYNPTNTAPKRYSPNLYNRHDTGGGGPLTVKVDADDKRQVSWKKNELPPRFQKQRQPSADISPVSPTPTSLSPTTSQMVLEIHCLGSSYAKGLVAYLQKNTTHTSALKVSRFFYYPGAKVKDFEVSISKIKSELNPKIPLLILLGENDVLMTTEKIKDIRKNYTSLILCLKKMCPRIQLVLVEIPTCICSYKNTNYLMRIRSFNEFLSCGLQNHAKGFFVINLKKILNKFEFFNCGDKKVEPLLGHHVNETGYSALVEFLVAHLHQVFDSSLFLNQSSVSNSATIISPLGPSQLIAAGRAKQEAEKAQLEQLTSNLLQTSNQQTNDLVSDFARLSHQDPFNNVKTLVFGERQTSFNGHNQIVEGSSALQAECPLPGPDNENLQNNMDILLRFCSTRNWPVPSYKLHKCPDTNKNRYFGSVKVDGDGAYNFKVGTIPFEHENGNIVKGYAAKKAIEKILEEDSKMVATAPTGLFANSLEDEYLKRHNERLPKDWLTMASSWPTLSVDPTPTNLAIVTARNPVIEDVYDPTVKPPALPLEALGDEENIESVYVTHATSVSDVWFRVIGKEYSEEYDVLVELMDAYYRGVGAQDLALVLEVDQYYAAHRFGTWFRVCVIQVHEDEKKVLAWLIDHGDNEEFSFGSLYRLAPQFCLLPQQAVHCTLEGLEMFEDDGVANEVISTNTLLIDHSLIAKLTHKDKGSDFVKAILYDTSGEDDVVVNELIKDEIIAKAKPVLPAEGCAEYAEIGHVSKKGEVYIMFTGPHLDFIAKTVESLGPEKISEHKLTSFKHISVNKIYLAKYSKDDTWYRAVVTATPSVQHNQIPVRFVDYGNTESVTISDIADLENLPSVLRKLPPQAVKVALHNLPINSFTNSEVARLHALLLDEEKSVLIKTVSLKADPPIMEIFTKEGDNHPLVSVNSTIELERKLDRSRNEENKNPGNVGSKLSNKDGFVLKCPELVKGEYQKILIVLAAHPGNFIFQPTKYAKDLKKLRQQMCAYYEAGSLPELPADRLIKNKLFAACKDDMWYRVVVTDSPMGTKMAVRLCDYGDVTFVNISSMRELAPEFRDHPFMAVKGKLSGVMPVHKDWSVEDCIRFQNLVVDKILFGSVVDIQENNECPMDMLAVLNLVDTSSEQDKNIAEILLWEKRALKEG